MVKTGSDNQEAEELARTIDEFKQKIPRLIEQERERLTEEAKQKSADIIIKAQEEAAQILKEAKEQAEKEVAGESARIIAHRLGRKPEKKLRLNQPAIWMR